jgi:hypothetical protein
MTEPAPPCPRCRSAATEVRSRSPIAGVWTVFGCSTCLYTWRSTGSEENRAPDKYLAVFRVDPAQTRGRRADPAAEAGGGQIGGGQIGGGNEVNLFTTEIGGFGQTPPNPGNGRKGQEQSVLRGAASRSPTRDAIAQ